MPTRSETQTLEARVQALDWAARPARPPRSIFPNSRRRNESERLASVENAGPERLEATRSGSSHNCLRADERSLQTAIDTAMARSFVYRFLAQAFENPTEGSWTQISTGDFLNLLERSLAPLVSSAPALAEAAAELRSCLTPRAFECFLSAYLMAFGHAARGTCPLNEIEYGDIKADGLFQPHRLADLAAFYRAFGLDLAADADERQDHICLELEFMCVLAAKEVYALEHQLEPENLSLCRDAQKRFLREHVGRWTPAFARRLARLTVGTPLRALADFTCAFIEAECTRYGVTPGSEDLLLRPVDEAVERMCHSCGIVQMPPGATPGSEAALP